MELKFNVAEIEERAIFGHFSAVPCRHARSPAILKPCGKEGGTWGGEKCKTEPKIKPFVSPEGFITLISNDVSVPRSPRVATSPRWQQEVRATGTPHRRPLNHTGWELHLFWWSLIPSSYTQDKVSFHCQHVSDARRCPSPQKGTSGPETLAGHRLRVAFCHLVHFALFSSERLPFRAGAADLPGSCAVRLWPRTRCSDSPAH